MNAAFSDEQIESSRRFLEAKREASRSLNLALWREAKDDADKIGEFILRSYRPRRLVQWGSVLYPHHFSEISDIDFAVEGLTAEQFDQLYQQAEEMTRFPLHLARWETIPPHVQDWLLEKGQTLHENP